MVSKPPVTIYRLYWSSDYNVPILNPREAIKYSSEFIEIKLTGAEIKPAFPFDVLILREAIYNEFKDWKIVNLLIPSNSVVLFNKIPGYPDEAEEVIINGELIGHRWFDPIEKKWRFKPLYQGVSRLIENRLGYWAIVDLPKLTRGFEIHRNRIVQAELPPKKSMFVCIQTKDSKWQGIAKLTRNKRLYIIKAWRSIKPYYLEDVHKPSIKDVIELNSNEIYRMENKSTKFIKEVLSKYSDKLPIVSYSGGKDSLVVLDLMYKIKKDIVMLFNDTQLELPDTYRNIFEVCNFYGIDLVIAKANVSIEKLIKKFGLPARDFRYCCKILKFAPISNAIHKLTNSEILSFIGQRMYESTLRAKMPKITRSRWVVDTLVVSPIHEWTSLHVWIYIFMNDLPYNKAYEKGFDRIGCWNCPANEIAEFELVKFWYPNIWNQWYELVKEYLDENSIDYRFFDYGVWRWKERLPGDYSRYFKQCKINIEKLYNYHKQILSLEIEMLNNYIVVKIKDKLQVIKDLLFKFCTKLIKNVEVRLDINNIKLLGNGKYLEYNFENQVLKSNCIDLIIDFLKHLVRSSYCIGCGLCIEWCRKKALKLSNGVVDIDVSKCTGCGICVSECPIVEYLILRSRIIDKLRNYSSNVSASSS